MVRKLLENLSLFALGLILAVIAWIAAVNEENPLEVKVFPLPIAVDVIGMPTNMVLTDAVSAEASVTIRALALSWSTLTSSKVHVIADLSDLSAGKHAVPLVGRVDLADAEILEVSPNEILVELERIIDRTMPIHVQVIGEPAVGYQASQPVASAGSVFVQGPETLVNSLSEIVVRMDMQGQRESLEQSFTLRPMDSSGNTVPDLILDPSTVNVTIAVEQLGGYRDVAVRAILEGKPAAGYRVTNIASSPPILTVFASDPSELSALPGFVETESLDIMGATDDVEARLAVTLPKGISPVGEQAVVVQVSIAPVESSLRIQQQVNITGLGGGLVATVSPDSVDVIMSGPLPILDSMQRDNVKVILDLLNLPVGLHQIAPSVIISGPEVVKPEQVLPEFIQVQIARPTITPTPTHTSTDIPTWTPTPTVTPTLALTLTSIP